MVHVITIDNLCKTYSGVHAVKDISFSIRPGEIFGIIGPNGAGKTTTLEMLEGILKPDRGTIDVLGFVPSKHLRELNKRIGVQFQSTAIQKKMKVKEAIILFASFYQTSTQEDHLIELLGLDEVMNVSFEDLSGGWKQRVTLALATIHKPEILFLDEPSMGLDPQARREMWSLIQTLRQEGCTIVITTHYMEEAEKLCDRVAMIYNGQLKALDTPRRLLSQMSGKYLSFESSQLEYEELINLPGIIKVVEENNVFQVYSEDQQTAAYYIFNYCHEHSVSILNFKFEQGNLDDLFVHYLEKEATR